MPLTVPESVYPNCSSLEMKCKSTALINYLMKAKNATTFTTETENIFWEFMPDVSNAGNQLKQELERLILQWKVTARNYHSNLWKHNTSCRQCYPLGARWLSRLYIIQLIVGSHISRKTCLKTCIIDQFWSSDAWCAAFVQQTAAANPDWTMEWASSRQRWLSGINIWGKQRTQKCLKCYVKTQHQPKVNVKML